MLPEDFDFMNDIVAQGMSNKHGGVNKSGRWGNRFVKLVDHPEHLTETGISNFLHVAGVPHQRVEYAFRGGEHLVHAPWVDAKPLWAATPEDADAISVPHALHTLTSEWLADVGDRHHGNYMLHGGRVEPLDFGYTGFPEWMGRGGTKPLHGALMELLRKHKGVKPSTPLPQESVRRLLDRADELQQHHRVAMSGHDKTQREILDHAINRRFAHLARVPRPTVGHLMEFS